MRICVVVGGMLEFGGLEEFAKNLALGVKRQGHEVSVVCAGWVRDDNQYLRALREERIEIVQLPRRLALVLSDWPTKERISGVCLRLLYPLVVLLAGVHFLSRRKAWRLSLHSAGNWVRGRLINRLVAPDRRKPFVRLLLNWWRLRWRPDLVHIHGYTSTLLFVIDWAHSKKVPVIYEEHQTPDAQFDWWKDFTQSINKATMVVAVSEASARALRTVCGVDRPVAVAYYMVPDPVESGWRIDTRPESRNGLVRVTTVARLYVTKGLTYLLEAIARVKELHPLTQFKVYGDGELREELLVHAQNLGLDGKQIFVGAFTDRDELPLIMAQTDIFVMSSILEGLPIALLEAMAYGRPIVATPVGGIPEAINDGVNGLLCEPRDPECLARKVCALIENPGLRSKLGRAARESYERGPYSPASVCARYLKLYEEVLATATR